MDEDCEFTAAIGLGCMLAEEVLPGNHPEPVIDNANGDLSADDERVPEALQNLQILRQVS